MGRYIGLIAVLFILSFVLIACDEQDEVEGSPENDVIGDEQNNVENNHEDSDGENESDIVEDSEVNESNESNEDPNVEEGDGLSDYSAIEIEYARVWLQLGAHQEIDKLYAERIAAGEPLNPNDETSIAYPEDVVQLSGSRLIDGVVTYSSNGDGTVNIYNVPKRWDGNNPAGEDFYKNIIDKTEIEAIDPGDDNNVIELIKKLEINS